jgi:hypothetical protein
MLLPNNRRAPRRFDYEPRYYDKAEDDRLKRRMRVPVKGRRGRHPGLIWLLLVLVIALLIYLSI